MKAPCTLKEQYEGIHYRVISNTISHLEVYPQCERINTAKQKDGLTSFLMLSVLETNIFQYGFLEEHKVCVNDHNIIDSQGGEMKSQLWQLNQNFWSPRKKC